MRMTKREIDHSERDRLVVAHIGLVKALAQRLAQRLPPQVEIPDLVSVGVLGLIDAAGRYRRRSACRSTRLRAAASRARCSTRCATSTGRRARCASCAASSTSRSPRLRHELGREPTEEEIATALEHDAGRVRHARSSSCGRWSSAPSGRSTTPTGTARRCWSCASIRTRVRRCGSAHGAARAPGARHREAARRASGRSSRCITSRRLTLAEIGEVIGVGESRVSQLRSLAISRLRTSLRETLGIEREGGLDGQDPLAGGDRRAARSAAVDATAAEPVPRSRARVVTYNFRRPDRVSKEQIRSLHFLHDRFARNMLDLAVGVPARGDRSQHRLGGAVHLLRVPDVAAGPDGVLLALAAADGGHRRTRDQPGGRVHDDRPHAGRQRRSGGAATAR